VRMILKSFVTIDSNDVINDVINAIDKVETDVFRKYTTVRLFELFVY